MALYHFTCAKCSAVTRRILKPCEVKGQSCKAEGCDGVLSRDPRPPSTQVMESLDNGAMPRRIERLRDAEALFKERAQNDPRTKTD